VNQVGAHGDAQHLVETAVHHYFAYRAKLNRLEFRHLLKQGRTNLIIGLVFLSLCLLTSELLLQEGTRSLSIIARESLVIAGWVAMWRPIRIFLYDWWPGFAIRPSVPEVEPHARRSAEAGRVKVTVQGQAVLDLTLAWAN